MSALGTGLLLAALVYVVYWGFVPARFRLHALFALSFGYLAAHDVLHAPVLLAITVATWAAVKLRRGRLACVVALAAALALTRALGPTMPVFAIAGFSYATFKLIGYAADAARDNLEREPPLVEVLAWIFFVPTFYAGPMLRAGTFNVKAEPEANDFVQGLKRALVGVLKKTALIPWLEAHGAAATPDALFALDRPRLGLALLALSIRIYVDFSAYSDIAIGTGRLLGVAVPENFRWPYLHSNIVQFWQHWHVTLSEWLRDYLFMPLSRRLLALEPFKKRPPFAALLAYLITFSICGAWHGLEAHFLVWGLYHGLLLGVHRLYNDHFARRRDHAIHRWRKRPAFQLAGCLVTFALVSVGWVFFVYPLGDAARLVGRLFGA